MIHKGSRLIKRSEVFYDSIERIIQDGNSEQKTPSRLRASPAQKISKNQIAEKLEKLRKSSMLIRRRKINTVLTPNY